MNPDDCKHLHGGPAFPLPLGGANRAEPEQSGGMSLRDYFAAKAMQALIDKYEGEDGSMHGIAESAYAYADEMLKAREAA